jgi:hypothetical protein
MAQLTLDDSLKFLVCSLNDEQKGRLFYALLCGEKPTEDISNLYEFILLQDKNRQIKRQHMVDLAKESHKKKSETKDLELTFSDKSAHKNTAEASQKIAAASQSTLSASQEYAEASQSVRTTKRKEAKENIIYTSLKNNLELEEKKKKEEISAVRNEGKNGTPLAEESPSVQSATVTASGMVAPTVEMVRAFVTAEKLNVSPEIFVNFYEANNWRIGQQPIKNWQATVRLWHQRDAEKKTAFTPRAKRFEDTPEDQAYWYELDERVKKHQEAHAEEQPPSETPKPEPTPQPEPEAEKEPVDFLHRVIPAPENELPLIRAIREASAQQKVRYTGQNTTVNTPTPSVNTTVNTPTTTHSLILQQGDRK